MTIKEIRKITGLSQKDFSLRYRIPLQTLKQWESSSDSASHRTPPDHVIHMLCRLIKEDFGVDIGPMSRSDYLIDVAQHCSGSMKQWLRYLRKEFDGDTLKLSEQDVVDVLCSNKVNLFQKAIFKRAIISGSETNRYIISLNEKAATPMIDEIRRRLENEGI